MKYVLLFILVGLLFFVGSKQKAEQIPNEPWTALTIISEDGTEITLFPDKDTATVKIYDSGVFSFFVQPKKHKTVTLKYAFTKTERDSIFSLVQAIISTPPAVQHHCTDYVGDLRLKIYYGETCTRAIDYKNVCNWNILSDKTMRLHDILKKRMKNVFLGEYDHGRSHVGD